MNSPAALDVALFRGESAAELLPITMIEPWPHNPRRSIDPAHLIELADSIGKVGVLQPILVRPIGAMFSIVSGERRFRAAKRAGLDHIPAVVRTLTDAEALEIAVTENLQREDVPPLDEAEGYERLHQAHGYTIEEIADKVGKSKTYVYSRLKLTSLCAEAREFLRDGKLTPTVALLVARIPTPSEQVDAAKFCAADRSGRPLSATEAAKHIRDCFMLRLLEAPFPLDDATLVPAAGGCAACPKRTGNQPELFGDVTDTDTCTDATCYAGKERAWHQRLGEQHEAEGGKVIRGEAAAKLAARWGLISHDYVDLRIRCPHDNGHRTWGQVLADTKNRPVLIEAGDDTWIRAVPLKAAERELVRMGMIEEQPGRDEKDENQDEDARPAFPATQNWQTQRLGDKAVTRVVLGTWPRPLSVAEWQGIVRHSIECGGADEFFVDALREAGYITDDHETLDAPLDPDKFLIETVIPTLDEGGCACLLLAIYLYEIRPSTLDALALDDGHEPETIRAEAVAAFEAEQAAKAKAEAEAKIAEPAKPKKPRKKKAATTEEPSDA